MSLTYNPRMRVIANPAKERLNRVNHRLGFGQVTEILRGHCMEYPDDRPLGYESEGRVRLLGLLRGRIVVLVFEPVEIAPGEFAVRPVSLRKANAKERQLFEEGS